MYPSKFLFSANPCAGFHNFSKQEMEIHAMTPLLLGANVYLGSFG